MQSGSRPRRRPRRVPLWTRREPRRSRLRRPGLLLPRRGRNGRARSVPCVGRSALRTLSPTARGRARASGARGARCLEVCAALPAPEGWPCVLSRRATCLRFLSHIAFLRYLLSLFLSPDCPAPLVASSLSLADNVLEVYPYRLFFVVHVFFPCVPLLAPFRRAQPVLLRGEPTSSFIRPVLIDGRADAERYPARCAGH